MRSSCPLLLDSRQSFHWSDECFQDSRTVRAETKPASGSWRPELLAMHERSHSPPPLQATTSRRQVQPHHFERVQELPWRDCRAMLGENQDLTNHRLAYPQILFSLDTWCPSNPRSQSLPVTRRSLQADEPRRVVGTRQRLHGVHR